MHDEKNIWPEDKPEVAFTHIHGVGREGTYHMNLNGFVETLVGKYTEGINIFIR